MAQKSKKKKITNSKGNMVKSPKVFKNISAFKRAMVQMDVKKGDKVNVIFYDGSEYTVESI